MKVCLFCGNRHSLYTSCCDCDESSLVRVVRDDLRVTQAKISDLLGIDIDTYGKWERGKRKPNRVANTALSMLQFLSRNDMLSQWVEFRDSQQRAKGIQKR